MKKEYLKSELKRLENEYFTERTRMIKAYCDAHNTHKVGDVVTDHIGSVKLHKISYYVHSEHPCCIYVGLELKKDGTPRKDGKIRGVYQCNERKS